MSSSVMIPLNNSSNNIEILYVDQNQPWFKRAHVGKFLGIASIKDSMKQIPEIDMKSRGELWGMSTIPLESNQNSTDIFLSEDGIIYVIINSKKSKCKELTKWLINRGIKDIIEEKRLAITEKDIQHRLAIETKDNALALLNDDLDESQREHAILEYRYEQLEARTVPYLEDPKKDNGMVIIQKNNGDEYPYVAICGQQGYVAQKIQNKLIDFPNGQIVVLAETPNAICHYNWLRERGCIEVNPDRVRHFRLGRNLRHQDLLGIQDA